MKTKTKPKTKMKITCNAGTAPNAPSAKLIRDLIYAWIYVTVSQVGNINCSTNLADLTKCLGGNNAQGTPRVNVTPELSSDIQCWVQKIQADTCGAYASLADLFKSSKTSKMLGPQPWTGQTDHPELLELDSIFANL